MRSIFARDFNLHDTLRPTPTDEFTRHEKSHSPEEAHYLDRLDVVGVSEQPHLLFPFMTKLEIAHPHVEDDANTAGVIVLDLDEVATAAAGSGSGTSAAGASVIYFGAGALALWFGTKSSIDKVEETTHEIKELKAEKAEIKKALEEVGVKEISEEALERLQKNLEVILAQNKKNSIYLKVERVFSGYIAGSGATTVAAGCALKVPLYGSLAVTAVGTTLLYVGAPIVAAFALGVAGHQAHRFYKAHKLMPKVKKLLDESQDPDSKEVYELLKHRVDVTRKVSAARSVSMTCMAAGAPATIFGGPYGLAVLLPGVLGSIIAGYIDTKKLGYVPQLTWKDKAALDGRKALINAIKSAHAEYKLLKDLKASMRLRYPIGRDAPFPFKYVARGSAFVRRKLKEDYKDAPADQNILDYLQNHLKLTADSIEKVLKDIGCEDSNDAFRRKELELKTQQCTQELAEIRLEQEILNRTRTSAITPDETMFCMLRHLIRNELFPHFSELVIEDKKLRAKLLAKGVISQSGTEYHVDANKLVLMFTDESKSDPKSAELARKLFTKGQDVLLTDAKDKAHFKERQLLDFLACHVELEDQERQRA